MPETGLIGGNRTEPWRENIEGRLAENGVNGEVGGNCRQRKQRKQRHKDEMAERLRTYIET